MTERLETVLALALTVVGGIVLALPVAIYLNRF